MDEEEKRANHLEDHYCIMYALLGRTLMNDFGCDGEHILRQATRYYGQDRGKCHRQKHLDRGMKINMYNLFTSGGDLPGDTRTFREAQRLNTQERVSHTLTCPMADIWDAYGCMDIGRIYCEEFHYSCYNTYAYGYTRVNIAKTLTQEGEDYCAFNVVLRPADLPEELQRECFEEYDPDYVPPKEVSFPPVTAKGGYSALWLKLYFYLLKAAVEEKGEDGKESIKRGLRLMARKVAEAFVEEEGTGNVDRQYLENHYPLYFSAETMDDEYRKMLDTYSENDARELVETEFIATIYELLGV